jgi:DNA-binding CsgD family transcriptional regulator
MDQLSKLPLIGASPTDRLSERQKQCLSLVAEGHTSKQIGRILSLSPSTVDNHLSIALERLGVDSRGAAARLFISNNQYISANPHAQAQIDQHRITDIGTGARRDNEAEYQAQLVAPLLNIPPLGGKENHLSQRRRFYHVIQIMFLALMAFSAVTITIAGIVHLFSQ